MTSPNLHNPDGILAALRFNDGQICRPRRHDPLVTAWCRAPGVAPCTAGCWVLGTIGVVSSEEELEVVPVAVAMLVTAVW